MKSNFLVFTYFYVDAKAYICILKHNCSFHSHMYSDESGINEAFEIKETDL